MDARDRASDILPSLHTCLHSVDEGREIHRINRLQRARDVALLIKILLFREVLEPEEMRKYGISTPHTSHCLPTGEIMISTMGNLNGDGLGEFFCIDAETLRAKGTWTKSQEKATFGYDFWYQPYHDTLIATEWGAPRVFKKGFIPEDAHNPSKYLLPKINFRRTVR